jgi:hypothetical protein
MKEKTMLLLAVMLVMLATLGAKAYADEMLGGEPKEFHAAIITMGKHPALDYHCGREGKAPADGARRD